MNFEFKLPDLGEGMVEGEVVKWHVKEGDQIREDDPMLDMMTDKATVMIPSPCEGKVLKLLAKEGEIKKVGSVLIVLETSKNASAPETRSAASPPVTTTESVLAAPATRHLAQQLGVELSKVPATGPGGQITSSDVRKFAETKNLAPQEERIPLRGLRRKIAEKMSLSRSKIPHYTYVEEADITDLVLLRDRLEESAARRGVRLTYLPFIIKVLVEVLKKFPMLNSSLDEEKQEIVVKHYYNLGIAAATPEGLTIPVLKNADQKEIFEIAKETQELSEKARAGKLSLEELQGSTFTITSLGPLGGLFATPIINYPEVAILGIHRIEKRPVVLENKIVIRDRVNLSLSLDHRVVDGETGAKFMQEFIASLANPARTPNPEI